VRVYTDAMYEDGVPSGLGIVVFVPPKGEQPARVLHASDAVPASFLRRFFAPGKRQYIGQLEFLAAIRRTRLFRTCSPASKLSISWISRVRSRRS